jgi:hypothetical protein
MEVLIVASHYVTCGIVTEVTMADTPYVSTAKCDGWLDNHSTVYLTVIFVR